MICHPRTMCVVHPASDVGLSPTYEQLYSPGISSVLHHSIQNRRDRSFWILPEQEVTETTGSDPFKGVHLELVRVVVGFLWSDVWSEEMKPKMKTGVCLLTVLIIIIITYLLIIPYLAPFTTLLYDCTCVVICDTLLMLYKTFLIVS